jgi:hypothetical protein
MLSATPTSARHKGQKYSKVTQQKKFHLLNLIFKEHYSIRTVRTSISLGCCHCWHQIPDSQDHLVLLQKQLQIISVRYREAVEWWATKIHNGCLFNNQKANGYQRQIDKAQVADRGHLFDWEYPEPSEGGTSE